jgi:hypothetical protein
MTRKMILSQANGAEDDVGGIAGANVSATCVSTTTVKQTAPKSTKNREAAYMG